MVLTPAQRIIAADNHRFRVIDCGRRFGKTTLAVEEIKGNTLSDEINARILHKNAGIAYIAPTYQQARDIAWENLKRELGPLIISANESRLELKVMTNLYDPTKYITIILRGWESIETLRGQKFRLIVLDEVALMKYFFMYWEEVLRPTLADVAGHAMFISTPKGFDHFYQLFNLENDPERGRDYKSFHFTTYHNAYPLCGCPSPDPLVCPHIPVDEIEAAKREMTPDRFAQEFMGDFRKMEGLVYKEFDRDRHIFDECPTTSFIQTMLGLDYGFTNPTAMLYIKRDYDNRYWVFAEWYKTQQTNTQIKERAASYQPNLVYPDPEAPEKNKELEAYGLNVQEVVKSKDSVQKGIDQVRDLFKQNRLFIHKSCVNLIAELETYRYPEKRPDHNEQENPVKEKDHAMDALRYAIMMNCPVMTAPNAGPRLITAQTTYNDIYGEL